MHDLVAYALWPRCHTALEQDWRNPAGQALEAENARLKRMLAESLLAHVPFFFKQWGGVHKKKAGRELEGRTWDEMPASINLVKAQ